MALVENICLDPNTAKCRTLLAVLEQLYTRVKRWGEGVDDNYYFFVRKGYHIVKVQVHPSLSLPSAGTEIMHPLGTSFARCAWHQTPRLGIAAGGLVILPKRYCQSERPELYLTDAHRKTLV